MRQITGLERYRYEVAGRRVSAIDAGGEQLRGLYSSDGKLLFENRRGLGNSEYVYLDSRLLAERRNGAVRFLHTDALGTASATTDAAGQVLERPLYTPFGSSGT